jgi:hypothetical protein
MKRWLVTLVVLISMSAVGFTILVAGTHLRADRDTPDAEASYIAASCYAMNHNLPAPPLPEFLRGKITAMSCSVPGA